MKATDLLKKQHKEVKALLEKVVDSSGAEGAKLLEEITRNLLGHMVIEQELFYPAGAKADLKDIDEGYEEHFLARAEIARAMRTSGDKTLFQARCKVVKELIEHHVEEEEDDMFPKLEKALGDDKMETLGDEMEQAFEALKAMKLVALSRRAEQVEVLADAKNGGKRKPAPRRAVKKKKAAARATRARTGKRSARKA